MLRRLRLSLLVSAFALAACDGSAGEEQLLFESEALSSAVEGIDDGRDWRVGPAYVGRVSVLSTPTPNPAPRGSTVSFTLDVVSGVPGGLSVEVLNRDARTGEIDFIPVPGGSCPNASSGTFCSFNLSANQINVTNEGGLFRLLVLDNRGIVTYGDVEVR